MKKPPVKYFSKYKQELDRIAQKLFSFQMKQPITDFFKLHHFDKDWFRALAQAGRRWVFKFKSNYKFNNRLYPKELFELDKKGENKANQSNPVVYNKIKAKGKYESQTTEKNTRES